MERNMHSKELFALALNIQHPWIIKGVKFDALNDKKELRNE